MPEPSPDEPIVTARTVTETPFDSGLTNIYGLPHKYKKLTDILAVGDAPAVVYPASKVDSGVVRADMESASPRRQSIRTAGKLPEELSASIGVG